MRVTITMAHWNSLWSDPFQTLSPVGTTITYSTVRMYYLASSLYKSTRPQDGNDQHVINKSMSQKVLKLWKAIKDAKSAAHLLAFNQLPEKYLLLL